MISQRKLWNLQTGSDPNIRRSYTSKHRPYKMIVTIVPDPAPGTTPQLNFRRLRRKRRQQAHRLPPTISPRFTLFRLFLRVPPNAALNLEELPTARNCLSP